MSILYSKLRLEVPNALDGQNAIITSAGGATRTVQMSAPVTDIMLAGMEKYRVQAGITDESVSFGYGEIKKVEAQFRNILKKLPYDADYSKAVVLNNEIHLLGGGNSDSSANSRKHYKWNGTNWVSVSTLPITFFGNTFDAVVLNGEIHLLTFYHYKWDGSNWTKVSELPSSFSGYVKAVVLNNQIHILGGTKHYKWNGSNWASVSTIPYSFINGSAVVLNNQIHLLGSGVYSNGYPYAKYHYKWNGSSWTSVSTLPRSFYSGSAVVCNGEIHIIGGSGPSLNHSKWDGLNWVTVSTIPFNHYSSPAVLWNSAIDDELVILGNSTNDAQWDGTSWTLGTN